MYMLSIRPHPDVAFDAVLLHGPVEELAGVQQRLCRREGPVVSVERLDPGETCVPLERLIIERAQHQHGGCGRQRLLDDHRLTRRERCADAIVCLRDTRNGRHVRALDRVAEQLPDFSMSTSHSHVTP